ncbi:hypothetical protein [Paenibacillus agilis]|uniref:Uncharacterized protein n=1 Tax=Paenibacillus agilis TaxID=3020863 RepID=A0A559IY12_9BACL|nr:hypothetical protein [Paenibacillus agilis]TVX92518.1 hypothetical protein FPZ44_05280 [Paenibacillus agilis]
MASRTRSYGRLWSLFRAAPKMLTSRKVPFKLKAFFVGAVVLYWLLPDFMPFIPIDDIAFTMIVIPWFTKKAQQYDHPNHLQ